MSLSHKMAEAHEKDLCALLGGWKTRGSGNQAANPMDGRVDRYNNPWAFAWDCKATRGESIGVSRKMWAKAVEQAGGERPLLPLRFYDTDRLAVGLDLVVIGLHDLVEMRHVALGD